MKFPNKSDIIYLQLNCHESDFSDDPAAAGLELFNLR